MLHRVVKPFPFSEDGFTLVGLAAGDERDFGAMADGLVAAGLIEPVAVDEPVEQDEPTEMAVVATAPIEMAVARPRRGKARK